MPRRNPGRKARGGRITLAEDDTANVSPQDAERSSDEDFEPDADEKSEMKHDTQQRLEQAAAQAPVVGAHPAVPINPAALFLHGPAITTPQTSAKTGRRATLAETENALKSRYRVFRAKGGQPPPALDRGY